MGKTSFKNILQILIILIFNNFLAQNTSENLSKNVIVNDTVPKSDTILVKKEQLSDVVNSKAESIRTDIPKKMTYLNRKAQVVFQDMQIDADYISIDWENNKVFARGELDSLGRIKEPAIATQGGKKY